MKNILQNTGLFKLNPIGIQVTINDPDNPVFSYIKIIKTKNEIEITEQKTGITTLDELKDKAEYHKNPVFLNIEGKVLIHKTFEKEKDSDDIFNKLPVKNIDDFLIQIQHTKNDNKVCSIIRKDVLENIMSNLKLTWDNIADISLGPFNYLDIDEIFKLEKNIFLKEENGITFNKSNILSFQNYEAIESKYINIDKEKLSLILLPLYSLIVSFYLNIPRNSDYYGINILKHRTDFKKFEKSKKAFIYFSILLILILIVNFLIYNNIKTNIQKNQGEIERILSRNQAVEDLKEKVTNMEDILSSLNTKNNGKIAFYIDKMMMELPDDIELSNVSYNPVIKNKGSSQITEFEYNTINIKGITGTSLSVNKWIELLKPETWINNISIIEYKQGDNNTGSFEINIELKKD